MTTEVLYDGGCGLCTGTVSWLRRLDWRGQLRFRDVMAEWESLSHAHPSLDAVACATAVHVVDVRGRITQGFDGFRTLAWAIPVLWPVLPILYVPGVPIIGRRVYAWVASRRTTTCVPPHARVTP